MYMKYAEKLMALLLPQILHGRCSRTTRASNAEHITASGVSCVMWRGILNTRAQPYPPSKKIFKTALY